MVSRPSSSSSSSLQLQLPILVSFSLSMNGIFLGRRVDIGDFPALALLQLLLILHSNGVQAKEPSRDALESNQLQSISPEEQVKGNTTAYRARGALSVAKPGFKGWTYASLGAGLCWARPSTSSRWGQMWATRGSHVFCTFASSFHQN